MPSGYTARIYEGENVTFPEFVMTCARGFGALIDMRDEPPGADIPQEFTPNPRYREQADQARQRLAEIEGWDDAQAEAAAAADHAETAREIGKSNAVARVRRERYEAMLASVDAWQPATPEHEELKRFMAGQLRDSIEWDCTEREVPAALSGAEFKAQAAEQGRRDVAYCLRQHSGEVQRAAGRTEWLRALRASLPATAEATSA